MKTITLIDHPEGGRFCEVFRSARIVTTHKGDRRSALTHIYFSLNPGEVSRFHRVASDEVWNLYQGKGGNLYIWDGSDNSPEHMILSAENNNFCHMVTAGLWQAAEPLSDTVLVGCSVAPGFEYQDFSLMCVESDEAKRLVSLTPDMKKFL
ncbi:MAG: cupin domain-containing protein [Desulfatiglans sp.]|jgi:predicted cupin superfamily sugar epimerase|nr:cupin domain-containing protein [Desulfatiglans sp.]